MRGRRETVSAIRKAQRPPTVAEALGPRPEERKAGAAAWLRGAFADNLGLKLLALILALTVYLLVNTDEQREINARVRVAFLLPADKVLVSERVDEVRVTVRGPWRRIKRFDEREIDRIDLDLTHVTGGEIAIDPEMIDLPRGLEITSIEPRVIRVAFEDAAQKQVPVIPTFAGRPLYGYQVVESRTTTDPPTVTVRGAAGIVSALDGVRAQQIRVDGRSDAFVARVPVAPPQGVQVSPEEVEVTVEIDEELVTRRLASVPVTLRGATAGFDPDRWTVTPATVDVVLTGGLVPVERWMDAGVVAIVALPPDAGRSMALQVVVSGAPPGVGVRVTPEKVVVAPRK